MNFTCSVCKKNFVGPYAIVASGPCCDSCLFEKNRPCDSCYKEAVAAATAPDGVGLDNLTVMCDHTPGNKLETPTSAVYKRFAKRLLAYNPSQHDLLVLLFRVATNEGGYTESDLEYLVDKIYSDRDVDADYVEGEVVENK
jgi:hypothetical protein